MRVKVEAQAKGRVPSETVVTIATTAGTEDVIVHSSQVTEDGVEVGYISSEEEGEAVLIELPRETLSGRWRVWVPKIGNRLMGNGGAGDTYGSRDSTRIGERPDHDHAGTW